MHERSRGNRLPRVVFHLRDGDSLWPSIPVHAHSRGTYQGLEIKAYSRNNRSNRVCARTHPACWLAETHRMSDANRCRSPARRAACHACEILESVFLIPDRCTTNSATTRPRRQSAEAAGSFPPLG